MNENPMNPDSSPPALEAAIPLTTTGSGTDTHESEGQTSLQQIVEAVLDSAGVANRSATLAANSTETLLNAVGDLGAINARARFNFIVVLFTTALLLAASAGAFFTVSVQLNSRLTQANNTQSILAAGANDLKEDLANLKRLDKLIDEIENLKTSENIEKLETKVDLAISEFRKQKAGDPPLPDKSNKEEQLRNKAVADQVRNLETQLQSQSRLLTKLREELQASRSEVSKISGEVQTSRGEVAKILGAVRAVDSQVANLNEKHRAPVAAPFPIATEAPVAVSLPSPVRDREKTQQQKNKDYIQYRAPDLDSQTKAR